MAGPLAVSPACPRAAVPYRAGQGGRWQLCCGCLKSVADCASRLRRKEVGTRRSRLAFARLGELTPRFYEALSGMEGRLSGRCSWRHQNALCLLSPSHTDDTSVPAPALVPLGMDPQLLVFTPSQTWGRRAHVLPAPLVSENTRALCSTRLSCLLLVWSHAGRGGRGAADSPGRRGARDRDRGSPRQLQRCPRFGFPLCCPLCSLVCQAAGSLVYLSAQVTRFKSATGVALTMLGSPGAALELSDLIPN